MAQGERAICNWDENALTMAVEATRDCLNGAPVDDLSAHSCTRPRCRFATA